MADGLKFSNTIGAPFRSFVTQQLTHRASKGLQETRTLEDVLYLANKNAWVRLQSSVIIQDTYYNVLKDYYNSREPNQIYDYEAIVPQDVTPGTEAARSWVLQSGTSKIDANGKDVTLRYGLSADGSYGLGGYQDMGYRPMPGLDSVTIETAGKQGSLRYATINFKVWNMTQLDIIDALYFRLGFTMLLEWGHVQYFTNDNKLQRDVTGIDNFYEKDTSKEKINRAINAKVRESCGNYDGMLGVVSNFTFSMNQDGGWDCSIKLVGLGTLLDTQRINSSYVMPDSLAKLFIAYNKADIEEKNARITAENNAKIKEAADKTSKGQKELDDAYAKQYTILNDNQLAAAYTNNAITTFDVNNIQLWKSLYRALIFSPPYAPTTNLRMKINVNGGLYRMGVYMKQNPNAQPNVYFPWVKPAPGVGYQQDAGYRYPIQGGNFYDLTRDTSDQRFDAWFRLRTVRVKGTDPKVLSIGQLISLSGGKKADADYANASSRASFTGPQAYVAWNVFQTENSILNAWSDAKNRKTTTLNQFGCVQNWKTTWNLGGSDTNTIVSPDANWYSAVYIHGLQPDPALAGKTVKYNVGTLLVHIEQAVKGEQAYLDWKMSEVGTPAPLKDPSTLIDIDVSGQDNLRYGWVQLIKDFTVQTTAYELVAGTNPSVTPLPATVKVTIGIYTELVSIVDKLRYLDPNIQTGAGTFGKIDAGDLKPLINIQDAQDDGLRAASSALEAWLALIQYDGAFAAKNASSVIKRTNQVVDITSKILEPLKNAPLNKIFSGNKLTNYGQSLASPAPESYYTDPYYLGLKGYNTALMSDQVNHSPDTTTTANTAKQTIDSYTTIDTVEFEKLILSYTLPQQYKDSEGDLGLVSGMRPVYIPFGSLLFFMNNLCMLFDSKTPPKDASADPPARPFFYVDFNPKTNFCLTTPYQLSTMPEVCLIPFSGTNNDYKYIFKMNGIDNPTNLFNFSSQDIVSGVIQKDNPFADITDPVSGKHRGLTMNILLNTQYLLTILRELVTKDGSSDVYFRPFINRILEDVNKALGGINAFRLGYIDESNTAAILDDQFSPPRPGEVSIMDAAEALTQTKNGLAIVPVFNQMSTVRSFDFQTNISTRMSSIIAIGARATNDNNGSTQAADGSPFYWLNQGLTDRLIPQAEDATKVTGTPPKKVVDNNLKVAENFNNHIKSIYGGSTKIDKAASVPMTNYYIQATTRRKAQDPATSGAPIIPVNASFTTDGISGINMGNVFLIPEEKLPISLRATDGITPRFGYMVMGLNHQIQSNQWVTNIRGQIIRLRPGDSYKGAASMQKVNVMPSNNNAPKNSNSGGSGNNVGVTTSGCFSDRGDSIQVNTYLFQGKSAPATSNYIFDGPKSLGGTVKTQAHGPRPGVKPAWQSDHAWDLMIGSGTPIYAIGDGSISKVSFWKQGCYIWGFRFTLTTKTDAFFYTHLDHVLVKNGDTVTKGQLVGFVGKWPNRPDSFSHLHLGIRNGRASDYLENDGKLK